MYKITIFSLLILGDNMNYRKIIIITSCLLLILVILILQKRTLSHTVQAQTSSQTIPQGFESTEKLPYLTTGVRSKQVSTHDRSGGGGDGFNGKHSFLYMDGTKHVLFDEIGPGMVSRMHFTSQTANIPNHGNIQFYFDDETTPRIDMKFVDFFSGTKAPFLTPLVGNETISSGGFYSYYPFYFKKRLKILMTGLPNYYNITSQKFTSDQGITSSTGTQDYSAVRQRQTTVGTDPKPSTNNQTKTGTTTIPPGQTKTLEELQGTGAIQSLKIDPSIATEAVLNNTWIKIWWDNRTEPSVNAPIGQFFGSYFGEKNWKSLLLGMSTNGFYYSYFPMPYWTNAKIAIENKSTSELSVPYEIQYATTLYAKNAGYFYATFNKENPTTLGKDYIFLNTTGKGTVVGITHSMQGTTGDYLEGDERVHTDDNLTAMIYGTQTDNFYNAGWSMPKGAFNLPLHGAILKDHKTNDFKTIMYRFFLNDTVPFENSIKFGIEHAKVDNNPNANYYSVIYYYKKDTNGLKLTDSIDIGKAPSESTHTYTTTPTTSVISKTYSYESDQDDVRIPDDGRAHKGSSQFKITIDPANNGVRLRRRMDYHVLNQRADVYVDGTKVGTWYTAGENENLKNVLYWRDEEFDIPSHYTTNKSTLTIKIEYTGNALQWDEYYYWIYSIMPFETGVTIPSTIPPTVTPTLTPTTSTRKPGDANTDGSVNVQDYNSLVTQFNQTGSNLSADFNNSGKVDVQDYNILVTNFGR
jgi:hypothetical protein